MNKPLPFWSKMPTHFGYYWRANSYEDWNIGKMVAVSRIETINETYFECENNRIYENKEVWFGPFLIDKPTKNCFIKDDGVEYDD